MESMIAIASIVIVEWCFQRIRVYPNLLEGVLNPRSLGFLLKVSDSVSLEWGLRMCISNPPPDTSAGPQIIL